MDSFLNRRKFNVAQEPSISDRTPLLFQSASSNTAAPPSYDEKLQTIPWKTMMIVLALFLIGTLSSLISASYYFEKSALKEDQVHWPSFAIIGILCLIPGGYYMIHILLSLYGARGYFLSDLPQL